jgi:hypothetical protein
LFQRALRKLPRNLFAVPSPNILRADMSVRQTVGGMLYNEAGVAPAIIETFASITRSTPWHVVDELRLRFDALHPQGMVRIGSDWWISTVDVDGRRGYVMAVDSRGELVERVAVGTDRQYHPGGLDFDGAALWIACAEYRPDSTTSVLRYEPGGTPSHAFDVDDHLGAIARCGPQGDLVGWSWGSRRFYRWSVDGQLQAARVNPAFFVDHQDCQWIESGHLLCAGVAEVGLATGRGWLGGLGLLDVDDLVMQREVPFPLYSAETGRVATHNPIWSEVRGDQLIVHLLPDDGAGTIVSYATPLIKRSD